MGMDGKRTNTSRGESKATKDILKSVLTWSHVITVSILILAAIHNIGGLIAIVLDRNTADAVIRYTNTWQTFFIAGVLGYDAKSTVENVTKITKSIVELRNGNAASNEEEAVDNG